MGVDWWRVALSSLVLRIQVIMSLEAEKRAGGIRWAVYRGFRCLSKRYGHLKAEHY